MRLPEVFGELSFIFRYAKTPPAVMRPKTARRMGQGNFGGGVVGVVMAWMGWGEGVAAFVVGTVLTGSGMGCSITFGASAFVSTFGSMIGSFFSAMGTGFGSG